MSARAIASYSIPDREIPLMTVAHIHEESPNVLHRGTTKVKCCGQELTIQQSDETDGEALIEAFQQTPGIKIATYRKIPHQSTILVTLHFKSGADPAACVRDGILRLRQRMMDFRAQLDNTSSSSSSASSSSSSSPSLSSSASSSSLSSLASNGSSSSSSISESSLLELTRSLGAIQIQMPSLAPVSGGVAQPSAVSSSYSATATSHRAPCPPPPLPFS